jgi:hypothetical protein
MMARTPVDLAATRVRVRCSNPKSSKPSALPVGVLILMQADRARNLSKSPLRGTP